MFRGGRTASVRNRDRIFFTTKFLKLVVLDGLCGLPVVNEPDLLIPVRTKLPVFTECVLERAGMGARSVQSQPVGCAHDVIPCGSQLDLDPGGRCMPGDEQAKSELVDGGLELLESVNEFIGVIRHVAVNVDRQIRRGREGRLDEERRGWLR